MKLIFGFVLLLSFNTFAQDNLKAHSHDKLELDVVVDAEDNKIIFALEGAAMSILGFEGEAKSKEHKEALLKVQKLWNEEAKSWLSLLDGKNCSVDSKSFENEIEEDDDHDHDHDHHAHHSEIEAEMVIKCKDVSKLSKTTFSFFNKVKELKLTKELAKEVRLSLLKADGSASKKTVKALSFEIEL